MKKILLLSFLLLAACAQKPTAETGESPRDSKGYDALLTRYLYPFPVKEYHFHAQQQQLTMAYMDLKPEFPSDKVIVMLHGKNFSGAYFAKVAADLQSHGWRVILPDQIGFGKSTKPAHFQYSFQALATYTFNLLDDLKIQKFALLGHSMGGMLATRMALMRPERVDKLILEDPIGLEDWKTLTPYKSVDELYTRELKTTPESIKDYQMENYYDHQWKPEYQPWVDMLAGWVEGPEFPLVAWNSALTSEMIYTQPVYYEFKRLQVPVVLIIGDKDRTAIGKAWAPPQNRAKMGNYPKMGRDVIRQIPHGRLVIMKGMGHAPHLQDFDRFMPILRKALQ